MGEEQFTITIEVGQYAKVRQSVPHDDPDGFTHDWEVWVRGSESASLESFIKCVNFQLHESFKDPKRVVSQVFRKNSFFRQNRPRVQLRMFKLIQGRPTRRLRVPRVGLRRIPHSNYDHVHRRQSSPSRGKSRVLVNLLFFSVTKSSREP